MSVLAKNHVRRSRFWLVVAAAFLAQAVPTWAGQNYAFLVAVADYDRKELKPLQFPRNDILELHKTLLDTGYDQSNIVLMHDDAKSPVARRFIPESAKIRDELKLLLADLEEDDTLILAFSGHGVQFKGEKQNYFCPVDAKLEDRSTLISVSEIFAALEKCAARQKLLLVDACRDDPQSLLGKARQVVELESVTRPQAEALPEGFVALFSCAIGEKSFEDPNLKHGVFFYHVLQALGGAAKNSDSDVTLDDVVSFTKKKTQAFARTHFAANQRPQQLGDFTGTWVLRSFREKPITPVPPVTASKDPPTTPPKDTPKESPKVTSTKPTLITAPSAPSPTTLPPITEIVIPAKRGPLSPGSKAGEVWDGNGLKMKFCWCPDGSFAMGSPSGEKGRASDEYQSTVTLNGFWLGKHEVTQAEWRSVMGTSLREQRTLSKSSTLPGESAQHPMYFVNHDEATAFCRTLTRRERVAGRLPAGWEYRLPTESQWEYACRAGSKSRFSCGEDESWLSLYAWVSDNSAGTTQPVGKKFANSWGLHDMHGNVWEWCRDWYVERASGGREPESSESTTTRVIRGGSWNATFPNARSAHRPASAPHEGCDDVGFRVVAVLVNR